MLHIKQGNPIIKLSVGACHSEGDSSLQENSFTQLKVGAKVPGNANYCPLRANPTDTEHNK